MIDFDSHDTVKLIDVMGNDDSIVRAAQVSVKGENEPEGRKAGLINYLMRERHGTPFEAGVMTFYFNVPIFTARQMVRHRMCLTGDTEVYFENAKGNGYWKRLDKHYQEFNYGVVDTMGRTRILQSVKDATVRSFDEDTLKKSLSRVLGVVKNGEREVFELVTERGKVVTASAEHKIFTPVGWRRLKELNVADEVFVSGRNYRHATPDTRNIPNSLRVSICSWSRRQLKFLVERDGDRCQECSEVLDTITDYVVDHLVPVAVDLAKALDVNNLRLLCTDCDRKKITLEQQLRDSSRMKPDAAIVPDAIKSITSKGMQETYDLVLEGPNHNFLANGIVVHNSSVNELSGRYRELGTKFYVPSPDRPLVNAGSGAHPLLVPGTQEQYELVCDEMIEAYTVSYQAYKNLLDAGIATEVARAVLPVGLYTEMYMTFNLRSLLNFLSLRTPSDKSKPQYEIAATAGKMEELLKEHFPLVWESFVKNGRVAP